MTGWRRWMPLLALLQAVALPALGQVAPAGPIDRILDLVDEYGPPVVLVEPERPEHPHDRRASAAMAKALAEAGLRCADGAEARGRRRALADGSVADGGSAGRAIAVIDRPDVDFVLRVTSTVRDAGSTDAYGIRIAAVECTLGAALVRSSDQSAVDVAPTGSVARSRSADVAALDAEAASVVECTSRVVEAIVEDWDAAVRGRRPWVVELESPSDGDAGRLAASFGDGRIVVLENRPGIRSVLSVPGPAEVVQAAEAVDATVVLRRPGYVLVVPARRSAWPWWIAGGAAALLAAAVAGWRSVPRRP